MPEKKEESQGFCTRCGRELIARYKPHSTFRIMKNGVKG